MTRFQNKLYQGILFFGDIIFFALSIVCAYSLRNNDFSPYFSDVYPLFTAFLPLLFVIIILYFISSLYEVPSLMTTIARSRLLLRLHIGVLIFGFVLFYIFPVSGLTPKLLLVLQMTLFTVIQIIWRIYISHYIRTTKKRKALLIGEGDELRELKESLNNNPQSSIVFAEHIEVGSPLLVGDTLEALKIVLKENNITVLVVDVKNEKVTPLLPFFYNLVKDGISIYDVRKMYEDTFRRTPLSSIGYFWFFDNVTFDMKMYEIIKRILDLILAIPILICFIISLPFVWIANKIEGEGDGKLFSKQKRLGLGGKVIEIYKFRTMLYTDDGTWRIEGGNKNRDTKVGTFLRKTNIDELPQVINILRGQMSFIGPRNDVISLGEKLHKEIPYYGIRYSIKPGISGWAQTLQTVKHINPQGLEENIIRFQYDLYYIKNRSVLIDVVIILRTIRILLVRLGLW